MKGVAFPSAERFDTQACRRSASAGLGLFARLLCRKGSKMDKHFLSLCSSYPTEKPHTISTPFVSLRPICLKT